MILIEENAVENVVCDIATTLLLAKCGKIVTLSDWIHDSLIYLQYKCQGQRVEYIRPRTAGSDVTRRKKSARRTRSASPTKRPRSRKSAKRGPKRK